MEDNISSVFGTKFLGTLVKVHSSTQMGSSQELLAEVPSSTQSQPSPPCSSTPGMDQGQGEGQVEAAEAGGGRGGEGGLGMLERFSMAAGTGSSQDSQSSSSGKEKEKAEAPPPMPLPPSTRQGQEKGEGDEEVEVTITGFVSAVGRGVGRSDNDRQFLFCNGRPVDLPKVVKVLNESWRRYEMKNKPACILNIQVPAGYFDVNLVPDKREIVIAKESIVLDTLKRDLRPSRAH